MSFELSDSESTLPALLRGCAERFGDSDMLALGERRLSFAEAERESARLARGLLASGVGKGTRVGLLMPNGPDWALAWMAACRIGALLVPLSTFLRARELAWNLRHADVQTLLVADRYLNHDYPARLEEALPELAEVDGGPLHLRSAPYLRRIRVWGECDRPWAEREPSGLRTLADAAVTVDEAFLREVEAEVAPADPMVVLYTSGSTAEPKGAVHTHGSALRHSAVLNAFRRGTPEDKQYSPMPWFWVGGFNLFLLGTLHSGACLFCEESFDVDRIVELIERERITIVGAWPHHAKAISEHPRFAQGNFDFVRYGAYATLGAPHQPPESGLQPNALGMTETFANHSMEAAGVRLPESRRGSFGRAIPGIERRIVDPQTRWEVAPGEPGELLIRSSSLMQGLYKLEREQVFTPDGFYATGDQCRIDSDDYLFFLGRLSETIKTGGANVAPREVEGVLESFEEVKEAYVVGVSDAEMGQLVVTVVVPWEGQQAAPAPLRERAREQLSAFKVPRRIEIMSAEEIPRTDSAKIQKPRLRELLESRYSASG
ncbi:MAG: acyl--CoA ligase [Proteobacteria bacterium]|nr:acyl--CoA ligase [Pseudomonadota bacterium]